MAIKRLKPGEVPALGEIGVRVNSQGVPVAGEIVTRAADGTAKQIVTEENVQQVVQASGTSAPASLTGTGVIALTQTAHAGRNWHAEPGQTALTIAAADWESGGELSVINHTGASLPIQVGASMTGYDNAKGGRTVVGAATPVDLVTLAPLERAVIQVKDGAHVNAAVAGGAALEEGWTANTYYRTGAIVRAPSAQGTIGAGDRIIRGTAGKSRASFDATEAALWSEVAEDPDFVAHRDSTSNPHGVTKAQVGLGNVENLAGAQRDIGIWTPSMLTRAIDLDFEVAPDGAVSSIANTGSLGGTADQTTAAQQPSVGLDAGTGRKGALFDGADDWLRSSAAWSLGATGYGVFSVFRYNGTGGSVIAEEYGTDSDVLYCLDLQTSAGKVEFGHFNGGWRKSNAITLTDGDLVVAIGNFDGANLNMRVFGVDSLKAETSLPDGTSGLRTRIGRRWDGNITATDVAHMRLFRLIVKDGAFTANEIQSLEAWAVRHFGLESKVLRPTSAHTHSAATTSAAGFMSATDKTKLDGVATGAAAVGSTAGSALGTAAVGTATTASRSDHVHPFPSVATTTVAGLMSATDKTKLDGVAASAAAVATTGTPAMDGTAALGAAATAARSDHVHPADTSKAPLASPTFTGTPTAPTATADTNTTQVATTAFVAGQAGLAAPVVNGTTAIGTSLRYARQDHVHPTDTTREATANKGVANGYASLGSDTKVPAAQLPAFATSLRLMTPADIIQSADLAINLLADDLALGAVATWTNSGTGGNFTQATATSQPTVEAVTALGGRRAALFADDFMETANISLGTRYGLFAVFIPTALGNQFVLSEMYVSAVEYTFGLQTSKFFVGHFNGAWRMQEAASPTPVINTPYILAAGYDGANLHVKVNGASATTAAQTSDPTLTDAGNIRLGRRWDGTTDIFDGHIACVIAKRGAYFTTTEFARLEGWAAWYYGRVVDLPGTHTYAVAPPLITA